MPGTTRVAFGDIVRLNKERTSDPDADGFERYVGLEHIDPGDLRIRRWGNVADGTTFTNIFRAGQVLFGKRRAYQRKVAITEFAGVCSGDIYVLESKDPSVLLPHLLPFVCQTEAFFDHAVGTSAGSLSPRTNWSALADFEFDLPTPDSQQEIVDVIEAANSLVEELEVASDRLRVVQASSFESAIKGCSDSFPLGEHLLESPRNGCSATEVDRETGHWVLALSAITRWGYKRGELKAVEPTARMRAATLSRGDLLVSRSNTAELVGLPAVFDEDRKDVSWPDTMMRLQPDGTTITPGFLESFLRSLSGRRQIRSIAAGTSASMKKINAANLKEIRVPALTIEQQLSLESSLAAIRNTLGQLQARYEAARSMRFKLLDAAFDSRGCDQ